ncbi:MAG: DUF397 domain-containing protein [Micromonosporaceae bacterium]
MLTNDWKKATRSNTNGACLYARVTEDGTVEVRDGKLGDTSPILRFTPAEWDAFLDGAQKGEFNRP